MKSYRSRQIIPGRGKKRVLDVGSCGVNADISMRDAVSGETLCFMTIPREEALRLADQLYAIAGGAQSMA